MEAAKFYEEIAEGPSNAGAYWIQTDDNVRLRVDVYHTEEASKGTILLMLGRFGYIERYVRVAQSVADNGLSTVVVDWRSQGLLIAWQMTHKLVTSSTFRTTRRTYPQ